MQEKLERDEEELRREKQRLMEERESQRLQRYVTPPHGLSNRQQQQQQQQQPVGDFSRHPPATGNDKLTDRQHSDAGGRGENVVSLSGRPVFNERQQFSVDSNEAPTVQPNLASPRQFPQQQLQLQQSPQQLQQTGDQGRTDLISATTTDDRPETSPPVNPYHQQLQQQPQQQQLRQPQQQLQQTGDEGRGNLVFATTTNERPETSPPVGQYQEQLQQQQQELQQLRQPQQQLQRTSNQGLQYPIDQYPIATSPYPLAPSVQPGTNVSPRQLQQTGLPRTSSQEDATRIDRINPMRSVRNVVDQFRPPSADLRFAPTQPPGYADDPLFQSGPLASYSEYNNVSQPRHLRQSSYDAIGDWKNSAASMKTYNQTPTDSARSAAAIFPYQSVSRASTVPGIREDYHYHQGLGGGGPYARMSTSSSSQPDLQRYLDPGISLLICY